MNMEKQLLQEKDLRANDEREFQDQIKHIIKEFEQFHSCFQRVEDQNKNLEKKYQDLQFNFTEFLTTLNVALFKVAQKEDKNEWTLSKEGST